MGVMGSLWGLWDPYGVFPVADISVSLLSVIVTFCGVVLLGVSLFVSWKLCWVPWRHKGGGGGGTPRKDPPQPYGEPQRVEAAPEATQERSYMDMGPGGDGALRISRTAPELPRDNDGGRYGVCRVMG